MSASTWNSSKINSCETSRPNAFTFCIHLIFVSRTYRREHCEQTPQLSGPTLVEMNELPPSTKIEWALDMAETVALLHNHERGVIVHDDIQLSQFLIGKDGRLKGGDFNRAEVSNGHAFVGAVFARFLLLTGTSCVCRLCSTTK